MRQPQQRRSSKKRKYLVYICDDQRQMIDFFLENQKSNFEISSFIHLNELKDAALAKKPDLVLIDLFWKIKDVQDTTVKFADDELQKFQNQLPDLREAIYRAYAPNGIRGLQLFRQNRFLRDIPIMIYSRTGQLLLSAEDIEQVILANAEWLPKHQKNITPDIECLWMEKYIENQKPWYQKPPPSDFRWQILLSVASAIFGTILGFFISK